MTFSPQTTYVTQKFNSHKRYDMDISEKKYFQKIIY
jgi:hypothetical protein